MNEIKIKYNLWKFVEWCENNNGKFTELNAHISKREKSKINVSLLETRET